MESYREELWFETKTRRAYINITPQVEAAVKKSGIRREGKRKKVKGKSKDSELFPFAFLLSTLAAWTCRPAEILATWAAWSRTGS